MDTETMIKELNAVAEKHKNDFVLTFQTNITDMCRDIIPKLEQLAEYEAIGTPEEYQEIKERQEAKQPYIWGAWDAAIPDMYDCPNCGESYGIGVDDYDHCPKCGQAFDKSVLAKQYE